VESGYLAEGSGQRRSAIKQSQSATPLAALASQLMRLHAAQGHAMADLSSVIHLYQDQNQETRSC
jgi:3-hydroxyisobutyrate dehydrogenase